MDYIKEIINLANQSNNKIISEEECLERMNHIRRATHNLEPLSELPMGWKRLRDGW